MTNSQINRSALVETLAAHLEANLANGGTSIEAIRNFVTDVYQRDPLAAPNEPRVKAAQLVLRRHDSQGA